VSLGARLVIGLASLPVSVLINGFVIVGLWEWFARPLGAPAINIPHAVGLSCLLQMLHPHHAPQDTDDADDFVRVIVWSTIVRPGFAFGIGAAAHWFMAR
jgi:hypothetical protein